MLFDYNQAEKTIVLGRSKNTDQKLISGIIILVLGD